MSIELLGKKIRLLEFDMNAMIKLARNIDLLIEEFKNSTSVINSLVQRLSIVRRNLAGFWDEEVNIKTREETFAYNKEQVLQIIETFKKI